ncbi:hypothetical protein GMRT_12367 [Giardia muris]|uniref:Uncharacterized protein n=1 Tax=Giardia muris TaxID=5742 RepID=A0A4Z1SNF5_GIAMU|nr:hypothetical protein GMRT_12367 [Giardia muris]|eukprot:TNJ27276.1 hypothetical protein GMRT_12367 [Giardia muris]
MISKRVPSRPATIHVWSYNSFLRYSISRNLVGVSAIPPPGTGLPLGSDRPSDTAIAYALRPASALVRNQSGRATIQFYCSDWPTQRAIRVHILRTLLVSIRTAEMAKLSLRRDRLVEAQAQAESLQIQLDADLQQVRNAFGGSIIGKARSLGYSPRLQPAEAVLEGQKALLDEAKTRAIWAQKQCILQALAANATISRLYEELSASVISGCDVAMAGFAAFHLWRGLARMKHGLRRLDIVVGKVVSYYWQRECLRRWLSYTRMERQLRREKILRHFMISGTGDSGLSEPSLLPPVPERSRSVVNLGALDAASLDGTLVYEEPLPCLHRWYNVYLAVDQPLTADAKHLFSLTDYSITLALIRRLVRSRRQFRRRLKEPGGLSSEGGLGVVIRTCGCDSDGGKLLDEVWAYRAQRRYLGLLRLALVERVLWQVAAVHTSFRERRLLLRTLLTCYHTLRKMAVLYSRSVRLRIAFHAWIGALLQIIETRYALSDAFHYRHLARIGWRAWQTQSKRVATLVELEVMFQMDRAQRLFSRAYRGWLLETRCILFLRDHQELLIAQYYRLAFDGLRRAFQRQIRLRNLLLQVALPRYHVLLEQERKLAKGTVILSAWRDLVRPAVDSQLLTLLSRRCELSIARYAFLAWLEATRQVLRVKAFKADQRLQLLRISLLFWAQALYRRKAFVRGCAWLRGRIDALDTVRVKEVAQQVLRFSQGLYLATRFHVCLLQKQAFYGFESSSLILKGARIASQRHRQLLLRHAFRNLHTTYEYRRLLRRLDVYAGLRLERRVFREWRGRWTILQEALHQVEGRCAERLLRKYQGELAKAALRVQLLQEATKIGRRYIIHFYLRRWRRCVPPAETRIRGEQVADAFYLGILERWAETVLTGVPGASNADERLVTPLIDIPNSTLQRTRHFHTIPLPPLILRAHRLVEQARLMAAFDEWRHTTIRRRRLLSMAGPSV